MIATLNLISWTRFNSKHLEYTEYFVQQKTTLDDKLVKKKKEGYIIIWNNKFGIFRSFDFTKNIRLINYA